MIRSAPPLRSPAWRTQCEREKEITEIRGGTAQYEVDWNSLANDAEALRFPDHLSCHRLNMALRLISSLFNDMEIYKKRMGCLCVLQRSDAGI